MKHCISEIRTVLESASRRNPESRAFVKIDARYSLDLSGRIDELRGSGRDSGPLTGLAVAVKDLVAVDGLGCGAGTRVDIAGLLPAEGAFVKRLKRAGAIIVGKTRTTEFALGGLNLTHPTPKNPLDEETELTPGGSSSGSAVAVGDGTVPLAVGTDTGGSVRLPAAMCGVVGYKSSRDLWGTEGIFPLSPTFDSLGMFGRNVGTIVSVVEACSDFSVGDVRSSSGIRVGVPREYFLDELDGAVASGFERVLGRLHAAGVSLVPFDLPEASECGEYFRRLVPWELTEFLGSERLRRDWDLIDPVAQARIQGAGSLTASEVKDMRAHRNRLVDSARQRMQGVDCWIAPTAPCLPQSVSSLSTVSKVAAWNALTTRNTRPVNLLDQCAISLPVRLSESRLPMGLQISSSGMCDDKLLSIALLMESLLIPEAVAGTEAW